MEQIIYPNVMEVKSRERYHGSDVIDGDFG